MNYFAIVNGINSICALTIAIIILRRTRKTVHLSYAFFYILLFLWASLYFVWGIQTNLQSAIFWMRLLEYPVCFIHIAYLHFALSFSETLHKYKKYLITGYALSIFFTFINSQFGFFDLTYVRDKSPFLFWPHGTPWLGAFIAFQVATLFFSFLILYKSILTASEPLKTRLKLFLTLAVIGWSGGLFNWFNFYDNTPIDPVGNPAVTIYLLGSAYLIFKHDILGLNFVFRKTFVYALLTLFITLIYTLFILLFEKVFQSVIGYKSAVISILSAMTIALLFNPLRSFFSKLIDRIFFGKDIEKLSSENSSMRDELTNSDRMKAVATLAAGMAHEIKNPLTVIKTFTEHLPDHSTDPEFLEKFTKIVGSEVRKVDDIVKQLLEFSKPTPPKLEQIDVVHILHDTLHLLDAQCIQHKVAIVKQFCAPSVLIRADKKQLQQVFLNLFLNGIQAMPNGGTLTTHVELSAKERTVVTISDTGHGIPKENISHIFDPFFTTRESGTGLGLAISHEILQEHSAKITVNSQQGVGTTFQILFNRAVGNR